MAKLQVANRTELIASRNLAPSYRLIILSGDASLKTINIATRTMQYTSA